MSGPERRRAPRVSERVAIAIKDTGEAFPAETKNLSTVGVYCTLDRFIPPMTRLQLDYDLPDGARRARIRCEGVVVRTEPVVEEAERGRFQMAIFFTNLTDRNRAAISRFVLQRLSANPSTP